MSEFIIKQALAVSPPDAKQQMERARRALTAGHPSSAASNDVELQKACQEMESIFLNFLLKEMRNTIHKSGFISGGTAENIYTGMLDAELSKVISERDGIGISKILQQQLGTASNTNSGSGDYTLFHKYIPE